MQSTVKSRWQKVWLNKRFRIQIISGVVLLSIILILFPSFLNIIEKREGAVLHDLILDSLPCVDLSIPIFSILWTCVILLIWQAIKNPSIFLNFLWGFGLLMISRIITISIVPLNPPQHLIPLIDPLINKTFYDGVFITKDLFYSGHTATMLLIFFCMENKILKLVGLLAAILVGGMVLVQHIHYTVDVLVVPFFTYTIYRLTKKITEKSLV